VSAKNKNAKNCPHLSTALPARTKDKTVMATSCTTSSACDREPVFDSGQASKSRKLFPAFVRTLRTAVLLLVDAQGIGVTSVTAVAFRVTVALSLQARASVLPMLTQKFWRHISAT